MEKIIEVDLTLIIFTGDPETSRIALKELQRTVKDTQLMTWLAPGVGLADPGIDWQALVALFFSRPPIFIRHICPAQITVPIKQKTNDLALLGQAAESFLPALDCSKSFSIQTRLFGDKPDYGRFNVNERLAGILEAAGAALNVTQPEQVLSVVCTNQHGYLGLSRASENLSNWAGGERRFKQEAGQISRSEFKLLEAMELYNLQFPAGGMALDLGAAPGGWTRILRRHAMQVVAVDPAELHPAIESDPAVFHMRQLASSYIAAAQQKFDVVLNDMRMDARDSARLMVQATSLFNPGCLAVVTLKLPERDLERVAAQSLNILRRSYRIVGARQLFHDRREITVVLNKYHQNDENNLPNQSNRAII